jgi:hypothetical protein
VSTSDARAVVSRCRPRSGAASIDPPVAITEPRALSSGHAGRRPVPGGYHSSEAAGHALPQRREQYRAIFGLTGQGYGEPDPLSDTGDGRDFARTPTTFPATPRGPGWARRSRALTARGSNSPTCR